MTGLRKTKIALQKVACMLTIVILSVYLISCSKDDNDSPSNMSEEIGRLSGLGDVGGTPAGTAFRLPDGISIVDGITGGYCDNPDFVIGSGLLVTVCFELQNNTDSENAVTFPAGLILLSDTDEYQHGVILREETVRIPGHGKIRIALYTYCGNSRRAGADSDASYAFGPVSNSKLIARLASDLNGKKINAIDYWDEDVDMVNDHYLIEQTNVQNLLWMITDGRDIDWQTFETMYREVLNEIPEED